MKGQATINGFDIWETWGASFVKGNYEKLLKPAPMKEYITNESRIDNGIVITNAVPRVASRELTLSFFIEGVDESDYLAKYENFLTTLEMGNVTLYVERLKKVFHLVYTECSNYGDFGLKKGKLAVKFIEPNPKKTTTNNN